MSLKASLTGRVSARKAAGTSPASFISLCQDVVVCTDLGGPCACGMHRIWFFGQNG